MLTFFCIIELSACSLMPDYLLSQQQKPDLPEQLFELSPQLDTLDSTEFLAISPQMQSFVDNLQLEGLNAEAKVNKIYNSLFYNKGYLIDYEMFTTQTAAQTFEQKRGNCVSLTAMMVALGRAAGLNSQFQEAHSKPIWHSQNGVLTKLTHVNTVMYKKHDLSIVVDFNDKTYFNKNSGIALDDKQAQSVYLNNLGSEALIQNKLALAYRYYLQAIRLTPNESEMWNNMGALLNRLEKYELAETVLEYAISLDAKNYGVLINLQNLYGKTNRPEQQTQIQNIIHQLYADNPHYLKSLAERALIQGNIEAAIIYIKKANELKPNLIDPNSIYLQADNEMVHYQLSQAKF
ncbi:hypothetical protein N7931_16690 [Catenovulum sp. 2E275]|uniref:transglutaminase domain-containing protein n=1 Tax=Catenovulum sp. 2E275 TaxID=2980497 RepID=UPI0021D27732|nr:transglutaminase domain-containing protein [Catenovulum sp. 2E275]MCU4677263.1 hypothetical protein [Catenovulum sp. 2E275]